MSWSHEESDPEPGHPVSSCHWSPVTHTPLERERDRERERERERERGGETETERDSERERERNRRRENVVALCTAEGVDLRVARARWPHTHTQRAAAFDPVTCNSRRRFFLFSHTTRTRSLSPSHAEEEHREYNCTLSRHLGVLGSQKQQRVV